MTIVSFVCAECQAAASVDAAGETDAGSTAALTVPGLQRHPTPHQRVRVGACNSHQHSPHHYQAQGDHCRSNDNPVFSISSSSGSPGGWWGRVRLQGSSSGSRSSNRTHSLPCFSGWFTHFLQALQRYTKHFKGSPDWHVTEFNIHVQKLP